MTDDPSADGDYIESRIQLLALDLEGEGFSQELIGYGLLDIASQYLASNPQLLEAARDILTDPLPLMELPDDRLQRALLVISRYQPPGDG